MRLDRFAMATVVATYTLLVVGSLVHGTGSSLACPDWPLCHGQVMPKMEHGVEYEHTHRLVAGAVALLTSALSFLLLRDRRFLAVRRLAWAAPVMVLVQAVLGGITVLYKLPKAISMSHLTLSMAFFSVLIVLAVRTREICSGAARVEIDGRLGALRPALGAGVLLVLGQIFLGGLVRHSMAGLACITWLLCYGELWPADSESERIHMLHRMGAVVAGTWVIVCSILAFRRARGLRAIRAIALAAVVAVLAQVTLGVLSVELLLDLTMTTAHHAVGALLLGTVVGLYALATPVAVAADSARDAGAASRLDPAQGGAAAHAKGVAA